MVWLAPPRQDFSQGYYQFFEDYWTETEVLGSSLAVGQGNPQFPAM